MGVGLKPRRAQALLSSHRSGRSSTFPLSSAQRGSLYLAIVIGALWLLLLQYRNGGGSNDSSFSGTIRDRVYLLTSNVLDEDLYGPPIPPRQVMVPTPLKSSIQPLRVWGIQVPETQIIGIAGGAFHV